MDYPGARCCRFTATRRVNVLAAEDLSAGCNSWRVARLNLTVAMSNSAPTRFRCVNPKPTLDSA